MESLCTSPPLYISPRWGIVHFEFDDFSSVRNGATGGIGEAAMEGEEFGVGAGAGDQQGDDRGPHAAHEAAGEEGGFC